MNRTPHTPHRRARGVRKLALAASVAAAFGALAMPAVGHAATSFGSPLTDEPNSGPNTPSGQCPGSTEAAPKPCTRVGVKFPSATDQDQKSPVDGVVTKFRIRSLSPDKVKLGIGRQVDANNPGLMTLVGLTTEVTLKGNESIEEFPAQIAVKAGDRVALETQGGLGALHGGSGGTRQYEYSPPLVAGQGPRDATDNEDEELLLQAVIEPDSDKDGAGDETQDKCPTNASTAGTCPTPDVGKPSLTGLALAPGNFRAALSGGAIASRAPIGTRIFYTLNETATVTFGVEKGTIGRKVGGRCVKKTKRNSSKRACLRFVRLAGSFKATGGKGQNGVRFSGRLNGHKLAPGSYKLVAVAKDPAGNKSKTRKRNFRIVK